MTKLKIVGLGGSLGKSSQSRAALVTALSAAAEAGADTHLLDLRELALPMYDPDDEAATESTMRMVEELHCADGILWSSPLYNGSISGAFKNALDWLRLLGSPRARLPLGQGDRADQRVGRRAGHAGDQHDGVLRSRASRLGRSARRPGLRSRTRFRPSLAAPRTRPSSVSSRRSAARSSASRSTSESRIRRTTQPNVRRPGSASQPWLNDARAPTPSCSLTGEAHRDDRGRVGHLLEHAQVDIRDRVAGLVVAGVERPTRFASEAASQLG